MYCITNIHKNITCFNKLYCLALVTVENTVFFSVNKGLLFSFSFYKRLRIYYFIVLVVVEQTVQAGTGICCVVVLVFQ